MLHRNIHAVPGGRNGEGSSSFCEQKEQKNFVPFAETTIPPIGKHPQRSGIHSPQNTSTLIIKVFYFFCSQRKILSYSSSLGFPPTPLPRTVTKGIRPCRTASRDCRASSPPVIAYDLAVSVHTKLARDTITTLAHDGAIAGLKDSSGDTGGLRYVIADMADRPDFFCMTGAELDVDGAMLMGAHGVVPGLGNVDPSGYVRLYQAARQGNWAVARTEQARLSLLFEIVWCGVPRTSGGASGVDGFKTAMRAMGIIATNTMARPQRSLNAEEPGRVEAILLGVGLL